jgi:methylglyoxal synthase
MTGRTYTLALIAHDGKKDDLLRLAKEHLELLGRLDLVATATTGSLLRSQLTCRSGGSRADRRAATWRSAR